MIHPERFVDCTLNATAVTIANLGSSILAVLGDCLYFYDPVAAPFPSNVVPETVKFVSCL